jgi:predicted Zn-dependent peptidase
MVQKINFITNSIGNFNMYIYVPAGSIYEEEGKRGLSHFLEHMLMKHTQNYTNKKLYEEITRIGGISNAGTSKDVTYYFIKTHIDNYKLACKLLLDIIENPVFTQEEFEKEKKIILEEFMQKEDNLDSQMDDLSNSTILSPSNPYVHPVRGVKQDIENMTLQDIRKFYKAHYKKYILLINCDRKVLRPVKKYIAKIFGQNNDYDFNFKMPQQMLPEGQVVIQAAPQYSQYSTMLNFPSYPVSDVNRIVVIHFIKFILTSAGFNSILFKKIREDRGLVYGIHSQHEDSRHLGMFKIHFSTSNPNVEYIVSLILSCLFNLKKNGITEKQLCYFKQSYVNRFKYFFSDSSMRELWYGNCLFYQLDMNETKLLKMLNKITIFDIKNVCDEIFNFKSMGVVSLGKYKNVQKHEREIRQIKNTYQ